MHKKVNNKTNRNKTNQTIFYSEIPINENETSSCLEGGGIVVAAVQIARFSI